MALADYNSAIAKNSNFYEAYYQRGAYYARVVKDYKKAIEDLTTAIGLKSGYYNAYILRAEVYESLSNDKDAIADYSSAIVMLIRRAALSMGPNIVTYGFTAVCIIDKPVPMVNKPIKNNMYDRLNAAGINNAEPMVIVNNPIEIPLFKPVFLSNAAEGNAVTK